MKRNRLSTWILIGLISGVGVGYLIQTFAGSPDTDKQIARYFGMLTDVFLRLIKMVIAPLVLTGVVAGMGHTEGPAEVGRIGARAILWFVAASVLSLALGLVLSNIHWLSHAGQSGVPAAGYRQGANANCIFDVE